ncbi:unnamed protein product [Brassicogethes aeneus]|uniref:Uncharacterized protein n=1 Tax=Brassicogethes aeneus TaxID=1431903 RepID=A0A9P0ATE8_BRAAE|nr:unnamed protein product [Brassicogethes aeneus]
MDLAEAVEDLICTFDPTGDTTMDTLAMLLFGWLLAALFVLWLGKFLYNRFVSKSADKKLKVEPPATLTPSKTAESVVAPSDAVDGKKSSAPLKSAPGGGGYVPPTPPVRKRITRQSPAPDTRKVKYVPAPQCTGPDNVCVLWVNDVFQWLYNDYVIVNELLAVWIQAMNDYTKKTGDDQGIGVELVRILPETHPPSLTNIFAEADSKDDVTITMDCEATPAFQLKSYRQKGEKVETSHYRVNVNRFRARMNIFCVSEKLQAEIKCDGWPEIKVALAPVGNIKNNLDETHLQEVITDILTTSIRNAEVHLNLAQYPTCPRLIRHVATHGPILPVHYDSMSNAYTSTPNHMSMMGRQLPGEKRLLVKVIRAAQLGGEHGCAEPFCVVEMDEPPQKNQTSVQKNTDSPYWDEHFLFDLSSQTAELLFEIYDRAVQPHKFLGLGIVGVEELLINPSQRQIISLQSRPFESDPVSGTLTVEFMFIEGADIPNIGKNQPYKIKENLRTPSPNRARLTTTTTTFQNDNYNITNGNHLASNALRDLDSSYGQNPNKSTLVIHSVQRQPSERLVKVELNNGNWKEVERIELNPSEEKEPKDTKDDSLEKSTDGEIKEKTNGSANGTAKDFPSSDVESKKGGDISATGTLQSTQGDAEFRGRSRKRRDFFGTIKRRLGKSKNRSKSAGPENDIGRDDSLNRSISADRGRNDENYRLNVPGQKSMDETSRRSSLSEASGMSGASTRTYINEASTLVLETIENGIKKHYLVPLSLAQKSKWRKKGTKLHIFNDHTFVAKHLQGGTICQVCAKSIARRFGKQGYECRDCLLKCHKQCHVKVNDNCPTSTIHNLELSMLPVLSE